MVLCTSDGKHDYLLVKMSSLSRYPGSAKEWGSKLFPWQELRRHVQIPVPNISLSLTELTLGAIHDPNPIAGSRRVRAIEQRGGTGRDNRGACLTTKPPWVWKQGRTIATSAKTSIRKTLHQGKLQDNQSVQLEHQLSTTDVCYNIDQSSTKVTSDLMPETRVAPDE